MWGEGKIMSKKVEKNRYWIDPKIVKAGEHGDNRVEYYLYEDGRTSEDGTPYIPKDPEKEFKATKRTGVCFSGLISNIRREKCNRIYYHMTQTKDAKDLLSDGEGLAWVELVRKHGMLPKHIEPAQAVENGIIVLDLTDYTPSQLYIYLSIFRYLREEPVFVKAMVYLAVEKGMDFYAAFLLASKKCIQYSGHHVIYTYRNYYRDVSDLEQTEIPLNTIIGLRRFVQDPAEYDKRKVCKKSDDGGYGSFKCNDSIRKVENSWQGLTHGLVPRDLFRPLIEEAIYAESNTEAKEHLDKFRKEKEKEEGGKK